MTQLLLIGLASIGFSTAELSEVPTTTVVTCTAKVSGPTFGFSGRMYFHFDTTCDGLAETIQIDASVVGPTLAAGTKTCTNTDKCSYLVPVTYKRGTWTWTNTTAYAAGTSLATKTQVFLQ